MFAHSQLLSLPTSRADSNPGLHRRRPPHCPLLHLRYQVNFTFRLIFSLQRPISLCLLHCNHFISAHLLPAYYMYSICNSCDVYKS